MADSHPAHAADALDVDFDPRCVECPPVSYRAAMKAMARLRHGYDDRAAMEFKQALEGDEVEQAFQRFLADPASVALLRSRPVLADALDDWDRLATLPDGSLGRRYHDLAARDGIRARDLVAADEALTSEQGGLRDPVRAWLNARQVASHDLLHVLTDYERDVPGELLVIAFTHAFNPKRIFPVSFLLGLLGVPPRHLPAFLVDAFRAWRRGRRSSIGGATHWETLLTLPIEHARARLGITSTADAHCGRIWRANSDGAGWRRVALGRGQS